MQSSLQNAIVILYMSYNVLAKCKFNETNLFNDIFLLCNSDNYINKSNTKPLWVTSTGNI